MVHILTEAAARNGHKRIHSALVELGELTQVEPETLRFGFEIASKDTLAQGCQLVYKRVPLKARCPQCGFEGAPLDLGCAQCGAFGLQVSAGREIRVVSIDIEDEDDA
jgi:hydrogenase nickel incorporation protein HypA/HybF